MAKEKKRPSKKTKAAQKLLESSKLLAEKTDRDMQSVLHDLGDGPKIRVGQVRPNLGLPWMVSLIGVLRFLTQRMVSGRRWEPFRTSLVRSDNLSPELFAIPA